MRLSVGTTDSLLMDRENVSQHQRSRSKSLKKQGSEVILLLIDIVCFGFGWANRNWLIRMTSFISRTLITPIGAVPKAAQWRWNATISGFVTTCLIPVMWPGCTYPHLPVQARMTVNWIYTEPIQELLSRVGFTDSYHRRTTPIL